MFPLIGLITLITISLSLLVVVMFSLSNTFAVANKDRLRSGDEIQLLMVHHHNEIACFTNVI